MKKLIAAIFLSLTMGKAFSANPENLKTIGESAASCDNTHEQIINELLKDSAIDLQDAQKIGMQIWMNEASQRRDLIVFWNKNESFPSLGIGHCIWFPEGSNAPYTQEFPRLCDYLQENGIQLPLWLKEACQHGAPWKSRHEFLQDNERTEQLRALLSSTVDLQVQFMIERLGSQFPLILKSASEKQKSNFCIDLNF